MKVKYIGKELVAIEKGKIYNVISVEKGWFRIMTDLTKIICSRLSFLK